MGFKTKRMDQGVIYQYFNKKVTMTNENEETYENSLICWLCKQELNTDKVRDHCHVTGKFRGASHSKCI